MSLWVQTIVTIVCSVFASSGFWAVVTIVIQKKDKEEQEKRESEQALSNMVRGLAHAKIIELGEHYIVQGYVTIDDLNEFDHYLYQPYEALGGNGYAKKIYGQVLKLPIVVDKERLEHDR